MPGNCHHLRHTSALEFEHTAEGDRSAADDYNRLRDAVVRHPAAQAKSRYQLEPGNCDVLGSGPRRDQQCAVVVRLGVSTVRHGYQ